MAAKRPPPPLPPGGGAKADRKEADEDISRFHDFCRRGQLDLAQEAMTENKGYAAAIGTLGNTAAHWAASAGHADVLAAALDAGSPVDGTNDMMETALHLAAWRGHVDCVRILLEAGARKDIRDKDGKTAPEMVRDDEVRELLPEFDQDALANMIQVADSDDSSDDE